MRACRAASSPVRPRPAPRCGGRRPPCPARSDAGPDGLRRPPRVRRPPREARPASPRHRAGLARPRDHRDHRPRVQGAGGGNRGAPLRERRGLVHARPHQRLRLARADGRGPRRRAPRRPGRARRQLLDLRMPGGLVDKLQQARRPLRPGQGRPEARARRRVPGGRGHAITRRSPRCPRSSAGPATPGATSRCHGVHARPGAPARATSGCTGCRCTTSGPSACTGSSTRARPSTSAWPRSGARRAWRWPSRSAAIPSTIYAASAPLPPGIDEMVFAGWLRGAGVPMVRCKTVDVEVPADAEIVLEGYVDPAERRLEGPFGDHTGYYSLARDYPVFHLTALTHRKARSTHHHRGPAAPGGLLAGQGHRAHLPAHHPDDAARGRGHEHAGGGRVPQPGHRLHPQALPRARAQGDVRAVGPRAHDAGQDHRGRRPST